MTTINKTYNFLLCAYHIQANQFSVFVQLFKICDGINMSAINLLNQPDTFGNYFQATPTPLPPIHHPTDPIPTVLYGVGNSGNKKFYRHNNYHQPSRHRPHSSGKPLSNKVDTVKLDR